MAWTNTNFYITTIFTTILIFIGLALVGTDLNNSSNVDLDEKSVDYINGLKGVNTNNGYDNIKNTSSVTSANKGILDGNDNATVSSSNDFLSTLYIKKERASEPTNFLKVIYNIPSSLVMGIGLPIDDFKWVINILTYILVISLLILVWVKFIRT